MRMINYLRYATLALVVVLLSSTGLVVINAQGPSACAGETVYEKVIPDAGATLYYAKTSTTFCARLEVEDTSAGWIALGISTRGVGRPNTDAMAGDGSTAVIGIVESASVKKFDLYNWGE